MPSAVRLFRTGERTDTRPARYSEDLYSFLNRVDDPYFAAIRDLLEAWLAQYPRDHRDELAKKFRTHDRRAVVAAHWELYLHEVHRCLGFDIEVHPAVPGTSKRPDFRLSRGDDCFYLEAVVAGYSDHERKRREREAVVLDTINDIENRDFSLSVDIDADGPQPPRRRELIAKVDGWLSGLDWQQLRARRKAIASDDTRPTHAPETTIAVADWRIRLTAYARNRPLGADTRPIGSRPTRGGEVDDAPALRSSLRTKASRYGKPDLPFVIALASMLDFADDREVEQALYGPEEFVWISTPQDRFAHMALSREPKGFWQHGAAHQGTRVSAVISLLDLAPSSILAAEPTLWRNPWAAKPLVYEYPFAAVTADEARNALARRDAATSVRDTFGLPASWPGVRAFERPAAAST